MSLFTLLSTAVAVPLLLVFAAFLWLLIRAQLYEKQFASQENEDSFIPFMSDPGQTTGASTPALSSLNLSASTPVTEGQLAAITPSYVTASSADSLSYQPLANYLGGSTINKLQTNSMVSETATLIPGTTTIQFDIKDIPGINGALEKELNDLGYTSVEQIARWGRADVRAVSAMLGIDQQKIEDDWIAGARLILSIK